MRNIDVSSLQRVQDPAAREALLSLVDAVGQSPFLGFRGRFVEIEIMGAVSNYQWPHSLGFMPEDVLVTSVIGGNVTFNFGRFTSLFLDITTDATATVRAFVGTYSES